MIHRCLTLILMAVLWQAACACTSRTPADVEDSIFATAEEVEEYSLHENIGEMLLVGFRGTAINSDSDIAKAIRRYHIGGVILFDYDAPSSKRGRNILDSAQLHALCDSLKAINPSLLIGIDQEGGSVSRLQRKHGFKTVASHKRTAIAGTDSVRSAARSTARMLRSVGINLDFAPVADVDVNPACPVIGALGRSFSSDAEVVAECCGIWIEELSAEGIGSCMKHFPGHGSARGDTHKGLVDVSDTWQRQELEPYRLLASKAPMVMTAHVVNRRLDASGAPASLSHQITALLRDSLGFEGVIVTDDLAMGAIANHYTMRETILRAINAGVDILCLSNNGSHYDAQLAAKAVAIIEELVQSGTVSEERIGLSANRIRRMKASMGYQ